MDIFVFDTSFVNIGIFDTAESVIWTERYDKYGDCEIYTKFTPDALSLFQIDYYLKINESTKTMIIESLEIKTNSQKENVLVVHGRSLESLLDRRIVLKQILIDGSFQTGILTLLTSNIINGPFPERNFGNFIFSSSSDPLVTSLNLKSHYYMDNLYDVVSSLCTQGDLGFRILLNTSNQFVFSLYAGVDRSYNQIINPYVVFSPDFDNLLDSQYFRSKRYKKNYIFVSGEEGLYDWNQGTYGRWGQTWLTGEPITGMFRREMFMDESSLSKTISNSTTQISDDEYAAQMAQRGLEELANNAEYTVFDGSVDLTNSYKYGIDFSLGDILQLKNEFGLVSRVRVTEFTFSENLSGTSVYPTLITV